VFFCPAHPGDVGAGERGHGSGGAGRGHGELRRPVHDAGTQGLLDLVNEQPNDARTILTVGHNPASAHLVTWLTGRSDIAFPACALAVIRLGESWAAVVPGGGELAALWAPGPAG
jgi:phosphohistidine phosphatase SixA